MLQNNRIEGIDYIRAVASVLIVIWHMEGGGHSLIFSSSEYTHHVFSLSDALNFHILLVAVPLFILVSNYLFASREPDFQYLKKRINRVFILLSFWPIAFIISGNGVHGLFEIAPTSIPSLIIFVLRAGNTIYYFFVCLIFNLLATYFILKLRTSQILIGFIFSILILFLMPPFTKILVFYPLSAYWNPLNFIPYPFAAVLLYRFSAKIVYRRSLIVVLAFVLSLAFSIIEWNIDTGSIFFPGQGYAIPTYTRVSLLFSSIAILIFALNPNIKSGKTIKFMAFYSLSLYCLHIFIISPITRIVSIFLSPSIVSVYCSIILVILCSYTASFILNKFYLKDEVVR